MEKPNDSDHNGGGQSSERNESSKSGAEEYDRKEYLERDLERGLLSENEDEGDGDPKVEIFQE